MLVLAFGLVSTGNGDVRREIMLQRMLDPLQGHRNLASSLNYCLLVGASLSHQAPG